MNPTLRAQSAGYKTAKCPDFYAICLERGYSLTHKTGRNAQIVMLNLSFSDKFASIRQIVADRRGAEWWSTYGIWPTMLFKGVGVRNTILVTAPGEHCHATRHNIFGVADRPHLFATTECAIISRTNGARVIRGGVINDLLTAIDSLPSGDYGQCGATGSSGNELFVKNVANYWFPVLFTNPPVLDQNWEITVPEDQENKVIQLQSGESARIVGSLLGGKLGFAWWTAIGDDYNVKPVQANLARTLAANLHEDAALERLARGVIKAGKAVAFANLRFVWKINVRWADAREATDQFDREVLRRTGLIEHWRSLNVWYRQCARVTRLATSGRYLTSEEIERYLPW
jgi:hypothetical protein